MLTALMADFGALPNISVTTALCPQAAADLQPNTDVLRIPERVTAAADIAAEVAEAAHGSETHVFLIAPEIGQVLIRLVRGLRRRNIPVIAPRTEVIEACSDKWQTFQLLQRSNLPTIPTECVENLSRLNLKPTDRCIVKPRDGAGCEGVFESTPKEIERRLSGSSPGAHQGLIVQPLVAGRTLSVAMIGQGAGHSPLFLPLAEQTITWASGRPRYRGGTVPAEGAGRLQSAVTELCHQTAWTLQLEDGYVGIDLLQPEGSDRLLITEINPRLCTSYLGYRRLTRTNLAECILHRAPAPPITWNDSSVSFKTD